MSVAESSWGDLRALAVGGEFLYALFARSKDNEGVLARVSTSGGTLTKVASVGIDPSALALSPDASFAFVAARGSSQVFRIDTLAGTAIVGDARGAPSSVVADDHAGAFWTLPLNDAVFGWNFASDGPAAVATWPRASSLVDLDKTLYVAGNHSISALSLNVDAAPRKIADLCDGGTPAVDGRYVYCADSGGIVRVELATGTTTIVAPSQPGAADLVLGAGRIFWRATPNPRQTLLMAIPLDGVGGATLVENGGDGPLLIAIYGCDLYFTAGRSFVRRAL